MTKKKIIILTGAGISAESGISTFRDSGGLWEGYDVHQVASPSGWTANPTLVNDFYNKRRAQLRKVQPNKAHEYIKDLEKDYDVTIITQNVDDLHERAGSSDIIHLHGELTKVRSDYNPDYIITWSKDLTINDMCPNGSPLRPHIVWFGEQVPMLEKAMDIMPTADLIIIIGTSMQVYPAASLTMYANRECPIIYIDPNPNLNSELENSSHLYVIQKRATEAIEELDAYINELL